VFRSRFRKQRDTDGNIRQARPELSLVFQKSAGAAIHVGFPAIPCAHEPRDLFRVPLRDAVLLTGVVARAG